MVYMIGVDAVGGYRTGARGGIIQDYAVRVERNSAGEAHLLIYAARNLQEDS